ncbi:MAG: hypothetical protein AMXMBFR20_32270 [Planctomycetia bacterium]|jgi:hypothetical protein|nr:MAG: hypothetical protein B6D36_07675 [Planctomycetes bacterium UTPLA1]
MESNGPGTSYLGEDGIPDWDAITFDVCCSRCGYNLRTLSRGLCPECGLAFEWREVLDRSASTNDFLFEHHWRTRPMRSWLKTVWRSFRPRSFWAAASIHDRTESPALWLMIVAAVLLVPVTLHGGAFCLSVAFAGLGELFHASATTFGLQFSMAAAHHFDSLSSVLLFVSALPFDKTLRYAASVPGGASVFFLASLGLISSLQQTLGRCRVRPVQVLRVVAYAASPVCVLLPIIYLFLSCGVNLAGDNDYVALPLALVGNASIIFIPGYYLSAGLKYYLHLPRPRSLGYVAALVSALTLFIYGTILTVMFGGP